MKQALPLFLLLCACAPAASSVFVELRTDLIPGIEFERIEVLRFSEDGTELLRQETRSINGRDFVQGAQVARLEGDDGDWLIEVRLRDAMDGLVVTQPVLVTVSGDTIVTALISRECRGVECPAALGNATDTACLAGECVSPRCTLESPEECGAPQCESDESCGSVECGAVQCLDGYCFASSSTAEAECGEEQYCDVAVGCRAIPTGADMDRDRWNDFEDCDDTNARVNPGASELCNGFDDDCDGIMDEGLPGQPFFRDEDGDGFGSFIDTISACTAPVGYVAFNGDCNDQNADVFPGATELCDGIDDNCDGVSDDQDGDGHSVDCEGGPLPADDCNDNDERVFPDAPEVCDSQDNDCDDGIDEAPNGWFMDFDGDGYGSNRVPGCEPGAVDNNLDCNDNNSAMSPARLLDPCGGRDQDCDGEIDEDPNVVWYVDADGDGVGVPGESITSCEQPAGYGATTLDCDDDDPTRGGGLPELCDGADNDCDPNIDEDPQTGLAANQNGVCLGSRNECLDGVEVAPDLSLIMDYEADEATCELMDNDCDGETDEGLTEWLYIDRDGDGYGERANSGISVLSVPELLCRGLPGVAEVTGDCSDQWVDDPLKNPGMTEVCDGADQDCDGATDEGTCAAGSLCAGASGCIPEVMPPTTLSGVIEAHTAWQGGGDILVDGIVVIDSGASLSVGPGTRFRFQPGAGFSVLGRLSAYGTDAAPVVFESASPVPSPTSWEGLSTGSSFEQRISLSHCEVRGARRAIDSGASARSCLFENNALAFSRSSGPRFTCVDCNVEATGLEVTNGSAVTFVGTRVVGGRYGSSRLALLDSEIVDPEDFPSSDNEIIGSTVRGFPGRFQRFSAYRSYLQGVGGTTAFPYFIVHSTLIDLPIMVTTGGFPPFVGTESSLCSTTGSPIVVVSGSGDIELPNNHWCTTDPAEIDALIFDDADDPSLGTLNYAPFLTEAHPLAP
ncbi:MAG: hypothetical protein ACI9KE_000803 [Polyangiales bacterium]